ncbi:16S rRNA (cytosine(1402)-N(4))-methyltransferase RsmH [Candidatus Gottesmanbacteria bacterium]|nr:16S rRNA (cytosine(1402)-N(4))-methyltransferase RsmH [Candidatus Gottesmanbacteria bacterium]
MDKFHISIMSEEIVAALCIVKDRWYVDATVGSGGHTEAIARSGGRVLGLDVDPDAIEYAKKRLAGMEGVILQHRSYAELERAVKEAGIERVDGIVFDLGVSSFQLDTPARGFSYRFEDAPLDMRFGDIKKKTAEEVLSQANEEELYEIIATYGEEERARSIAHALVRARKIKKIVSVSDLNSALITIGGTGHDHFRMLSRVYQALRIVVNDEMRQLQNGLLEAEKALGSGGKLIVLTFHSIEDRVVKRFMLSHAFTVLTKKPIMPSKHELYENSRARSVKMRIAEKL